MNHVKFLETHDVWGDKALWEVDGSCSICGFPTATKLRTTEARAQAFPLVCRQCAELAEERTQ